MKKASILLLLLLISNAIKAQCFISVSSSENSAGAVMSNGTIRTWGRNVTGQLGDGTTTNKNIPTVMGNDTDWHTLAAGGYHMLAIKTDGTLWAWGYNNYGQLGNSTTENSLVPIQVGTDTDWLMVACGQYYSTAIKTNGTLWAWGYNHFGQLGNGNTNTIHEPIQIGTDTNWQYISNGAAHTIALKTDGSLWAWGWNNNGRLGINPFVNVFIPTQVGTDTDWKVISAGQSFSFAIKTNGELWSWGWNSFGNLGDGTEYIDRHLPVHVGIGTRWVAVAAGMTHTLAIASDGTLWSCGNGHNGRLGYIAPFGQEDAVLFHQVGTDTRWLSVSAGYASYGIKTTNNLSTWGYNINGELGQGSFDSDDHVTPTEFYCSLLNTSDEQLNTSFTVFPVPATSYINIKKQSNDVIDVITIYNSLGEAVLKKQGNNDQIDIEGLQNGIYLLKIESGAKSFYRKFIKE